MQVAQLRLLIEINRLNSLSRAADVLGLTQSTASRHLNALEEAVGKQLAERSWSGVRLTIAGQRLIVHAQKILDQINLAKDELNDQIFPMRRKFISYKDYSEATIDRILTPEQLGSALKWTVTEARSVLFRRNQGKFKKEILLIQSQFAPVTQILAGDFSQHHQTDVLLLGNKSFNRLKLGTMDANYGCLLKAKGLGFEYVNQADSGLSVEGDVKSALQLRVNNQTYLVIGAFDQPLQFYHLK